VGHSSHRACPAGKDPARELGDAQALHPLSKVIHHDRGQVFEGPEVLVVQGARLAVNYAQSAQVVALTGAQRNTRVELQAELAGHQGVGQGSRVRSCVLDDPRLILENGGRAQAWLPVDVADVNAVVGLEPDAVVVDHTDNCYGYAEEPGGKGSDLTGPRGEGYREKLSRSPAGRAGTPDEVATVGALLMGPDGAFITGSDFLMDGGVTASYFYGELAPK